VSLERGPLSLVSTTEKLLGRKSMGSGLENWDYSHKGSAALTTLHHLSVKVGNNLTDKRQSFVPYNLLWDSGHGVSCVCF
jgi:hypothetical protein